jgi:hypothetical protein
MARPQSGKALTNAEKQRRYRERVKARTPTTLLARIAELEAELADLTNLAAEKSERIAELEALIERGSRNWI